MLHKYRYLFLLGFIAVLALTVFVAESILSKNRLAFVVDLHQQALENIAFTYDLNLSAPISESIGSATAPILPSLPNDPILQNTLKEFPSFINESWKLVENDRKKYIEIKTNQSQAIRITEERQEYEIQMGDSTIVRLSFLGDKKLESITALSDEEKRSLSISYYPDGRPNQIVFGMWSHESMGIDLKFHRNGTPQHYVYIFQGSFFGPNLSWNEEGSINNAEFLKRPIPIVFDKRAN